MLLVVTGSCTVGFAWIIVFTKLDVKRLGIARQTLHDVGNAVFPLSILDRHLESLDRGGKMIT